jgi:hypothetical protein
VSQPHETLELRLTEKQIAASWLRIRKRKRQIEHAEQQRQEVGVINLGYIDSNMHTESPPQIRAGASREHLEDAKLCRSAWLRLSASGMASK